MNVLFKLVRAIRLIKFLAKTVFFCYQVKTQTKTSINTLPLSENVARNSL